MADSIRLIEQAPLQARDLLQRLSHYFDSVDHRLRQGEGWFIFNAQNGRSRRIASFMQHRLAEHQPPVSYFLVPWRDFALSAYVAGHRRRQLRQTDVRDEHAKREFELAARVTYGMWTKVLSTDLLIMIGLKPAHRREAELLDRAIGSRHAQRLATILVTPEMPQELEAEFQTIDPTRAFWDRIFSRMYETSLVAL